MKRSSLRRVSKKYQSANNFFHKVTKPQWIHDHPYCEICGATWGVTIHHKMRRGKYLNDTRYFMTLCRVCHDWVEANKRAAREKGYILYK